MHNWQEERERVVAVKSFALLDTPEEPEFDAIAADAAQFSGAAHAVVSLIDRDRQWYKARFGVADREVPRALSFCTHTIKSGETTVVPDARADARFAANPFVIGAPFVRSTLPHRCGRERASGSARSASSIRLRARTFRTGSSRGWRRRPTDRSR